MHDRLTVVSVYGHHDGASAIPALTHSIDQLPGSRGLLISIARPKELPSHIEWKQCEPMTYKQYSVFCMHCLASYIDTDYCLIVQDDGWVLQGEQFYQDFYQFDYLGAPTHSAMVDLDDNVDFVADGRRFTNQFGDLWDGFEDEGAFANGFSWIGFPDDKFRVIQCGGFSLRSKRLLEACNRHGMPYRTSLQTDANEDSLLTAVYRNRLEELGYRFAPLEVARQWAVEYVAPAFHSGFDLSLLVGHHARSRKLVGPMHIKLDMDQQLVEQVSGEPQFLQFLTNHLGYKVEFPDGSFFKP